MGHVPAGARLRAALDELAPGLARVTARLWSDDCDAARYRAWLTVSHQVVRATAPLLADAVQECLRRQDPLAAELAPWFAEQLTQEYGHETWLLADYAATGGDAADLLNAVPAGAVARFAGAPAYWLRHTHPLALLGHIALLEWYPPDPALVAALPARIGLPATAFRTLREHAVLDAGHGGRLLALLDSFSLGPEQHALLLTAATTSAGGLIDVVELVLRGLPRAPRSAHRGRAAPPARTRT